MKLIPASIARRIRRLASEESGLTLIEVMATALIVTLLAAATATALIATAKASGHEQFRSEANSLAAQDQEQIRGLSDTQLYSLANGAGIRTHSVTLGGITFTVSSTASFGSTSTGGSCAASSASYYDTTSTVQWRENGQLQTVTENSLLTRPVYGSLSVKVNDSVSNPIAGVSVRASTTLNGQVEQQTQLTNSSGCVFFTGLDAGNYTVTLSKAGYVDANDNANPSYAVAVPSSGTSATYMLGQASGPINATFQTVSGGSGSGEAGGVSWLASGWTWSTADRTPTSGGTTSKTGVSSSNLYPQTYAVWAGRCPGQEPPTASGHVTSATVTAGQSVSLPVIEPILDLQTVKYTASGTSTAVTEKPTDVVLTYSGTVNSVSCTDSWPATVTPATTEPSTGWLANPGQPYAPAASLLVCVDYLSGGTYYYGTATVANTTFTTPLTPVTVAIAGSSKGQCAVTAS